MPVRDRALLRASDPEIWAFSFQESRTVVTKNAAHFLHLAECSEIHAGLIIVPGRLNREGLRAFIDQVLTYAMEKLSGDLINQVIYVDEDGTLKHKELCKAPASPAGSVPAEEPNDTSR